MPTILLSMPHPWNFGAYAMQSYYLLKMFHELKYEVIYVNNDKKYNYNKIYKFSDLDMKQDCEIQDVNSCNLNKKLYKYPKYVFLPHYDNDAKVISDFNEIIKINKVDYVLFLGDILNLITNENFICKSLIWYPNHFEPLDRNNKINLEYFDTIICLAPSAIDVIKEHVTSRLVYVPHVIDYDTVVMKKDSIQKTRTELRKELKIPDDTIVISIIGGNYERSMRKGFDTSFQVFKNVLKIYNNVFLYVQAHRFAFKDGDNDLINIMESFDVPKDKYIINQTLVDSNRIEEIYKITDILLMGSKTEGFGVPLIEAQIRGIPVVTNKFAAMKDHTYYGITCESEQSQYDQIGAGLVALPNVKNLTDGLLKVVDMVKNNYGNKNEVINKIKNEMSFDVVKKSIHKVIEETKMRHDVDKLEYDFCVVLVGMCRNKCRMLKFDDNKFKLINVNDEKSVYESIKNISYKYLICLDDQCSIIHEFVNKISEIHNKKSIVCIMKTLYNDGMIYPMDNNFTRNRRVNIMVSNDIVQKAKFKSNFFDDLITFGLETGCATVTEHIIATES